MTPANTVYCEPATMLGHTPFNCNYFKCHVAGEEFKRGRGKIGVGD